MIKSISILFPIYNEEKRLQNSLKMIDIFLKKNFYKKIEVILIDDGSTDGSKKIIELFLKKSLNKKKYKFISYKKNVGKGYALSRGVSLGNKDWILTCDIDFSVKLEQIINWEKKFLKKDLFVYFGSRMHSLSTLQKNYFRNIIGSIFKLVVYILFKLNISDTQCGFKLYKKKIAKKIFFKLIEKRYVHDVEIALRCIKNNIQIIELPVNWKHKSNGKINIFIDPFVMFVSLLKLKIKMN
jgi:dolichyl-phosphate beta-glucosyltransferase